jgi:2-dehydropantoate 2-reductase
MIKWRICLKIGIIGTGAVGGYYGALLAKSGFDVHFLLRSDFDHVRQSGLRIESKNGDFKLDPVNCYFCAQEMPECDIIIVALKTIQNNQLRDILPLITTSGSIVVLLQNGLGVEKEIADIVPQATVMGGLCFLCSNKIGPGHIRHLDYGSIRLGQYQDDTFTVGITDELKEIADIFSKADIPVQLEASLDKARWEKLVWNMAFNGTTVILDATTDILMTNNASRSMVSEIMREVIRGAKVCGYDIDDGFVDLMLSATEKMVEYRPSMKLDYDAKRPLETESIYWRPIRAVTEKGHDMPKSRILASQLDFLDWKNRQ